MARCDDGTSAKEQYIAYQARHLPIQEEDILWLTASIPHTYKAYNTEQAREIIDICLALKHWKIFKHCSINTNYAIITESSVDCLVTAYKAWLVEEKKLRPTARFKAINQIPARQLRHHTFTRNKQTLEKYGVPYGIEGDLEVGFEGIVFSADGSHAYHRRYRGTNINGSKRDDPLTTRITYRW